MISFKEDNSKFNFRVGAIILSRDKRKVLLHTIKGYDFYLLPGGRVEMNEDSTSAIRRELKEELGLENIQPSLRLYLEDFFKFNGENYHEFSINFFVQLDEKNGFLEDWDEFLGVEGEKYIFKWVEIDKLDSFTVKPAIMKKIIKNYSSQCEHIILHEV